MEKKKKENVDFIKTRDFGDKLGAPIYFFIQEFKLLSLTILRFAGPWLAITILATSLISNSIYKASISNTEPNEVVILYGFLILLFLMIGFLVSIAATHSYISLYVKEGKGNFTIEDVGNLIKKKIFKIFFAGILISLIVVLGFLFFYIPGIYLAIAMSFFSIVIVYEDANIGESISRSFKIIKGHWWETFGLTFVFGLIVGFASYVFIIPIYVIFIVAAIGGKTIGAGSVIVLILFISLYFVAYMFFVSLKQTIIAVQYFSLITNKEGMGLKERIASINKEKEIKKGAIFEEKTETEDNWEDLLEKHKKKIAETKEKDYSNKTTKKIKEKETKKEDGLTNSTGKEKNRFLDNNENDRFKPKY